MTQNYVASVTNKQTRPRSYLNFTEKNVAPADVAWRSCLPKIYGGGPAPAAPTHGGHSGMRFEKAGGKEVAAALKPTA